MVIPCNNGIFFIRAGINQQESNNKNADQV
jgi:hypothetical protein